MTLREDLAGQQDILSRSQGEQWIRDMRTDADALMNDHQAVSGLAGTYIAAERDSQGLVPPYPRRSRELPPRFGASRHRDRRGRRPVPALSPAIDQPSSGAVCARVSRTGHPDPPEPGAKLLMAMVTAAVMLAMALICLFTVRSVLLPLRQILHATHCLAKGSPHPPVTPRGIRELATLAVAFNEMAERLGAAQENGRHLQQSLETQVLERTHKLQRLAEQDPLTSLPIDGSCLECSMPPSTVPRATEAASAVYFLDIDNFKNHNDSLGHVFGDRVLMSVANRLEEIAEGTGFVARFGGDEFTIIYETAGRIGIGA